MSGMMTNDPLSVLKTLEASRIKPETRMQCKVCGQLRLPRLRLSSPFVHRS